MEITWLNQGGFLFVLSEARLVVDAYLSDTIERTQGLTRLIDPPFTIDELRPDFWLCTHNHLDHLDSPTVGKVNSRFSDCKFIGPSSVQKHLTRIGISHNRIIPLSLGGEVAVKNATIYAVYAKHTDHDAIGVLVDSGKFRVYLSGDSEFPDNPDELLIQLNEIDIMLICINGKWGNMNHCDALSLVELVKPRLAIPMHYGLFAENTVLPDEFLHGCKKLAVNAVTLKSGQNCHVKDLFR